MGTLIDSSVLIAAERGKVDLKALLAAHSREEVGLAAITASELLHGVHRADSPTRRSQRATFVEGLIAGLPIVPFDLVAARIHARLWAELAKRGVVVGTHDLLIAATAMAIDYSVATRDVRSFPKIPGLTRVDW